jgi:hypothetical protein
MFFSLENSLNPSMDKNLALNQLLKVTLTR